MSDTGVTLAMPAYYSKRMQTISKDEARWQAVLDQDASMDGAFVLGVKTTGIYCRPICPARRPNRENVLFFDACADAEAAGFRACKRCQPSRKSLAQERSEMVARSCRSIDDAEQVPTVEQLAGEAGLGPAQFQRVFKLVLGVSPSEYIRARRSERAREALRAQPTIGAAMVEAGFESSGRFYESTDGMLGMKPSEYRSGSPSGPLRFTVGECSLGSVLVVTSERGICGITMGDDPEQLISDFQNRFPKAQLVAADSGFESQLRKVLELIESPGEGLDLPLDILGTAFQHRVWKALRQIPAGRTKSYGEIAESIGSKGSTRAVASACASNPIAVAIPCHRVVRSDGDISGYRWGVGRKRALLDREGA
jgi:AraC family transcriptional regulator of adaptative response/methylated-DNA-[protein]-cysteine methyltransferase